MLCIAIYQNRNIGMQFTSLKSNRDGFMNDLRIALIVPCYNEAATIEQVISAFKASVAGIEIYVYDNNSSDNTIEVARQAGAFVYTVSYQGKGNVVRKMFADVEADVYIMVDGDNTYDAESAPLLIKTLIDNKLDMVAGKRMPKEKGVYRQGHKFGNKLLTGIVASVFGRQFDDILTGYRVFSRRFVKSFPSATKGFEVETELTIYALEQRLPVAEIETPYGARIEGSESKLNTYTDGFRILKVIFLLTKEEKPLQFFSVVALVLFVSSLLLAWPIVLTYVETGLVPRFPTAILSMGLMLLSFLSLTSGVLLDSVAQSRKELKRLQYLRFPAFEKKQQK